MVNHREKIQGWKAICAKSGWSATQIRRFERNGLRIQRQRVGGTTRVWIYRDDLEKFLLGRKSGPTVMVEIDKPKPVDRKPITSFSKWAVGSSSLILFILIAFRVFQLVSAPKPEDDYIRYETHIDEKGHVPHLDLITEHGEIINVWNPDKIKAVKALMTTVAQLESRRKIQFQVRSYEYPAVLTQRACLGFPKVVSKGTYQLPGLTSIVQVLGNCDVLADFYYGDAIIPFDDGFSYGWMVAIKSYSNYLSGLCVLDREFQLLSTVYHPGHIRNMVQFSHFLAVSVSLNAREDPKTAYRSSLFAIPLAKFLIQTESQVLPFSNKTIPSEVRRQYYRVSDLPVLKPEVYYGGLPGTTNSRLVIYEKQFGFSQPTLLWRALFGSYQDKPMIFPHTLEFNIDLELTKAYVIDQHVPRNNEYDAYYSNLKYQKWEGQDWSPWMGAHHE